jgi:DNA-binding transcriptional regulator YdaS (Cro superfamily)
MEKLKLFIKALPHQRDRIQFAKRCGTTLGYFMKTFSIPKARFGARLCVRIEQETAGAVTRKDLLEDWREVWPELIDSEAKNAS